MITPSSAALALSGRGYALFTRDHILGILRTSSILQTWSRTREESMDEKDEARERTVDLRGVDVNVSPHAFHIYAGHYYKCKQDFMPPDDYVSSLPYFLLCRAIELELKARLLRYWRQSHVKRDFGHSLLDAYNVVDAYNALDAQEQILSQSELAVLTEADAIYSRKG